MYVLCVTNLQIRRNFSVSSKCQIFVKSALLERVEYLLAQIVNWQEILSKYVERLDELRNAKSQSLTSLAMKEDEQEFLDRSMDSMTDSTDLSSPSTHSKYSGFTGITTSATESKGKLKRKQFERKTKQVKEGSQYEDAAILVALKNLYKKLYEEQSMFIVAEPC